MWFCCLKDINKLITRFSLLYSFNINIDYLLYIFIYKKIVLLGGPWPSPGGGGGSASGHTCEMTNVPLPPCLILPLPIRRLWSPTHSFARTEKRMRGRGTAAHPLHRRLRPQLSAAASFRSMPLNPWSERSSSSASPGSGLQMTLELGLQHWRKD